jgi:hypothetical protein
VPLPSEEKYKAKKEETVTGPVTETYNNGHKTTVNAALREEYSNAGKRVVTEGGHEEIISSQHDLTVHGPANITTDGKVTWNVEKALWELNAMNYSLNASAFNRTDSGSSHDTVQGFKSELVLGMKNDMLMGVHTEVKVAGCLSLFGGVAFEYALGKQRGTVWEVSMWAIKNETAAAENRLKAMENDISSMKNDAAAMENRALPRLRLAWLEGEEARAEGGGGCGHRGLVFSGGLEFFEGDLAVLLFFELLNLKLGVLEPCLAHFEQLIAFLKSGEQLGERHIARLHRFDDGLEFSEGVLER